MDPLLAFLHHLAAFGVAAAQAVETTALRGPLDAPRLARLATTDRLYRIALVLLAGVGAARVLLGPKGAAFHLANPWFWAKIVLVAAIGAFALPPARAFRAWLAAARHDASFSPPADAVARARRHVLLAAHLLIGVLLAATLMARGIGL